MKKLGIFLTTCFVVLCAGAAQAETINFVDSSIFWPGWGKYASDNSRESIGIPTFSGGSVTVSNGRLTNLTFNQTTTSSGLWGVTSPGDLFIDLGANQNWDFIADLTNWTVSSSNQTINPDPPAGYYKFLSINLPLGNYTSTSGYILSGQDGTNGWSGLDIRSGHAVAAANITYQSGQSGDGNSVWFSGWNGTPALTYSFNFANLNGGGLYLGNSGNFTIGWEPNCANDVIYEKIHYTPTPEPASLSLLGLGLLGLVGLRKRGGKR